MGNTNVREGGGQHPQAPGGARPGHASYGVPPHGPHGHPQAQRMRDPGRLGHAPSTESMSQSPSESPGSAARSPLMFTPQVSNWLAGCFELVRVVDLVRGVSTSSVKAILCRLLLLAISGIAHRVRLGVEFGFLNGEAVLLYLKKLLVSSLSWPYVVGFSIF